jgi:hypothetical protein
VAEPRYVDGKLQPLSARRAWSSSTATTFVDAAGDIYVGEWNAQRRYPFKSPTLAK